MAPGMSGNPAKAGVPDLQHSSLSGKRPLQPGKENEEPSPKLAKCPTSDEIPEWDDELQRELVAAIFDVGLRNASPAVILDEMTQKPKSITSERVKSKLQKYRNNKDRSKLEFLEEYDAFSQRVAAIDSAGGIPKGMCSVSTLLDVMGMTTLFGGDAAAYASFAMKKEQEAEKPGEDDVTTLSSKLLKQGAMDYVENFAGTGIPFPVLTEAEKKSSLGVSMTFVMGLFLSMTQHIMQERESAGENEAASAAAPHTDLRNIPAINGNVDFAVQLASSLAIMNPNGTILPNPNQLDGTDDHKPSATASSSMEAI